MMKNKSITLSDIAKRLNVSTVTVSKALRNHPDISIDTIKRIKIVAEELGYTPNFMARNLSSRRSNMIGVVVPKIAHHFFSSMIENIYNFAFEHNYEIILTVSQENAEREKKHVQTLLSMKVDGILVSISQQTNNYDIYELVRSRGVPMVFVDRTPDMQNINTVTVDDRGGAYKMLQHAINLGYRKIGHFSGNTHINIGRERLIGYKNALINNGIEINPDWIIEGGFSEQSGYDSFMKLYRENNLPDLIFAVTFPVALGIYNAAGEVGIRIPNDIDLFCFGYDHVQSLLTPALSCVNQPTNDLAVKSMEMLLNNIGNKEDFEPQHVVVDTELILRETCIKYYKG
ncbi:MAG: LacI family DNA-binding transcriptional regulator [bacterium]